MRVIANQKGKKVLSLFLLTEAGGFGQIENDIAKE